MNRPAPAPRGHLGNRGAASGPVPGVDHRAGTPRPDGVSPAAERDVVVLNHRSNLPPPLVILALPRSFTSLVCAMLGQHPQLYGLPETHLLCEETLGDWFERAARAPWPMAHGLLRAVAQLYFGAQDETTIRMARKWLMARSDLTTEFVFKLLADRVFPLALADKSPSTVDSLEVLQRARAWFPQARFIHLVRHPRGYGESVMKLIKSRRQPLPPSHWLLRVASRPAPHEDAQRRRDPPVLDPQNEWHARNTMICDFLQSVPDDQHLRVRGEDLLREPDETLRQIATWMGLRTDASAIEEMKHPERSHYAFPGPLGARYGNDGLFLQQPALRPGRAAVEDLEAPLAWRHDGQGFSPYVKLLARDFGYK